ncbi:MAG: protein kinase [Acidobacteria bacterium]|nr:protein kinase [Acidobacteriota bacterium]
MSLTSGTRVGPYEVVAPLGAGGMGEVYRARDTRLKRDVALKILPASFAADPDRLVRFQREAEVLASLNHPNIAAIHGLEESGGALALVMELVEGETLAERIARGPIPVDEVLPIARQIAEGLEAAHEHGVIHRDLKPANIKVRPDGAAKVLDFGLAKALEAAPAADVTAAPTITSPAMTRIGVILGTAAYMSPEQAKGRDADRRSDVWAVGCVLYEMLTGRRAFEGEDVSDTLAAVLRAEPDWGALPPGVPRAITTLLRSCLVKDRRKRLADVSAVRFVLDHAASLVEPAPAPAVAATAPAPHVRPWWRRAAPIAVAALVSLALGGAGVSWWAYRGAPPVVRTTIAADQSSAVALGDFDRSVAIAPDGSRIVYRGDNLLFVRSLDRLQPTALSGLGAPRGVFISPDGQWVGFFDGQNALKKVAITGGPPVQLSAVTGNPRGATWDEDDTVIFATSDPATGLLRVSAGGGDEPAALTKPDRARGELDHIWPESLPGGEAVLFTIAPAEGTIDNAQIAVLDLRTNTQRVLVRGGSHAQYVPTGHLIYGTGNTLRAVAFDLARLEVRGTPVPVLDQVTMTIQGGINATVSANGALLYVAGTLGATSQVSTLMWVDRNGAAKPVTDRQAEHRAPRISPDGSRVAVAIRAADGNEDIWVVDVVRGTQTRLTSERAVDTLPLWTPDSKRVAFTSNRAGLANALHWIAADGSGAAEALTRAATNQGATSWTADGSILALYDVGGGYDIFTLKPGSEPVRFMETPFQEQGPAFSADGRWIAYSSNESGRPEIYIAPYPGPGGKIAVSSEGGRSPRWSSDGRELFYRNNRQVFAVPVTPGPTLSIGTPRVLFEGDYIQEQQGQGAANYDISGDGKRFVLMARVAQREPGPERPAPQMILIQNWTEELKRLVPVN